MGVSASPPVSGYKSAAGSRVVAKLQKELPPVALLQQRPHRLPSLRAFRLCPHAATCTCRPLWNHSYDTDNCYFFIQQNYILSYLSFYYPLDTRFRYLQQSAYRSYPTTFTG